MKKMFAVLLMLALTLCAAGAMALSSGIEYTEVDGIKYRLYPDSETAKLLIGKDTASVVIPATIPYGGKTYKVTEIGGNAFHNCTSLTSVTIPDSVTSIGLEAFGGCTSLKSVTIPKGVTSIGMRAFTNCTSLESVTIPKGVTSIETGMFNECYLLKNVTIPEGVTSIGDEAFWVCMSLESVTIPGSVTSIGNRAFRDCIGLESVTIPEGVKNIGAAAFYYCKSLESVTFSGTNPPDFGDVSFTDCDVLQTIYVPEGSEEDYKNALEGQYTIYIDDNKVFCAPMVEGYALPQPEPQQPAASADLPRTGDHSSLALWLALLGLAGAGMMMRRRAA